MVAISNLVAIYRFAFLANRNRLDSFSRNESIATAIDKELLVGIKIPVFSCLMSS